MKKSQNQKIGNYTNPQKVKDYYTLVKDNSNNEAGGIDANIFCRLKQTIPQSLMNKNVIDLGCGDGRWSEYFASLDAKNVYALDISKAMLKQANKRFGNVKNIQTIHADMNNLPLKNNSIDTGLSSFSMMYFADLEKVVNEISRILKNNGILYIVTNIINVDNPNLLKHLYGKSIPIDLGFDKKISLENLVQPIKQYRKAFKNAGLTIKTEEHFEPVGVEIPKNYKHRNALHLEKVLFVVQKDN